MTPFELFFGLTTVILGLALTHMANSLQQLLRGGRRVRWAPEPILQAALVLMIVVFVWVDQWGTRNESVFTVGQNLLQVTKLLAVYIAAAAVLPDLGRDEKVDLHEHYLESRRVTFGALIAGFVLFSTYYYLFLPADHVPLFNSGVVVVGILIMYVALMFVRWRSVHIAGLLLLCAAYAAQILPRSIGS